ncbi:hypothetical protein J2S09_003957 [Bacillus fengqiuensis]|nr:hypothetical protein [Bacillus fengqiuensis]
MPIIFVVTMLVFTLLIKAEGPKEEKTDVREAA